MKSNKEESGIKFAFNFNIKIPQRETKDTL
jgi:hypothetical protein